MIVVVSFPEWIVAGVVILVLGGGLITAGQKKNANNPGSGDAGLATGAGGARCPDDHCGGDDSSGGDGGSGDSGGGDGGGGD